MLFYVQSLCSSVGKYQQALSRRFNHTLLSWFSDTSQAVTRQIHGKMHIKSDQEVHRLLKEAATDDLHLALSGDCMTPDLRSGANIKVRSTRFYWPGDVLVYRDPQDRLLAHRLIGYYRREGKWKCLIQADNARRPDSGVSSAQVIGKVVSTPVFLRHRMSATWRYIRHVARYFHH